ncbi:MAG: hypothetical protein IJJ62_03630 [Prevotella sp.]|nr:hypothetical protein [Prevotella sp.]
MRKIVGILVLLTALMAGCTSIDCPLYHTADYHIEIIGSDMNLEGIGTDTIWVFTRRADGQDTLLQNALTDIAGFDLPASYMQPEDTFYIIRTDTTQAHKGLYYVSTLYIKKENHPHFESVDCQANFFHTITGVRYESTSIDSIVITNPSVTYDQSTEHLYIYLGSLD